MKKNFFQEYKKFFQENTQIFSLPLLISWASDINSQYKGVHIKQKIPLRVYIGINKIKNKKIHFNKIKYFDINEERFIEEKLIEYSPVINETSEIFNEEYKNKKNLNYGLEFNIFAETGKGQGMGFISNLIALTIIGYKCHYKEIYQNIDTNNNDEIMNLVNTNTFYNDLLKTSIKLNKKLSREISISNQTSSLFNGAYPTVSFVQKNYATTDIDKLKLFGYKLNSLSKNLPKIPYIPIDFGLIYTGMPVSISQILYSNKHTFNKENKILKNVEGFFGKDIETINDDGKPLFYDLFINKKTDEEKNKSFIDIYLNLMSTLSLKILNNHIDFYKKPFEEYLAKKYIQNVNKITRFNLLTKKCSEHFKNFIFEMMHINKKFNIDFAIAPNDTMLMGGNSIFAMKCEGSRGKLIKAMTYEKEKNSGIKLVYANWLDGIEKKGLIIEQNLDKKIFSEFISKDNLILINSKGDKKIIDSNYIENTENKKGLFLDLTKNKIFLNGEKLTSKELKSQNTTIEVLLKLLENKGEFISNKDLSVSSYSTNKNDMSSKIILPLQKLIKRECNIDLKISLIGTSSNFKLKLDENFLDINIIRYISKD